MLVKIIQIGNSQGIRIPKSVLNQCNITNKVEMEIKDNKIILKPINTSPRQNWDEQFKKMHLNGDDDLLIEDSVDPDMEGWEW